MELSFKIKFISALLISGFLSGCVSSEGISPLTTLLDSNTLDVGTTLHASSLSGNGWPHEGWWQQYRDPQLDTLVEKAIADNPTIQVATARLHQASASAEIAGAALEPRVDGNLSINRTKWSDEHFYPKGYSGLTDWNNQGMLSLSFDLDIWGKHKSEVEEAVGAVRAAEAETQSVKLSLEASIVRAYVQLSLTYTLQDILNHQLQREQETSDIAAKRFKAGIATELETSQAQAPLPALRGQIEKNAVQITVLRNQLAALTGQGPGAGEAIKRPTLVIQQAITLPTTIPAELLGRRPDVIAHRWQVEAASKHIEVAKTQFMPNFNLMATAGSTALTPGIFNLLQPTALTYGIGPAISLPIFDAGRLRGNLGVATAGYDAAVSGYNDTVIHALENVATQIALLKSLEIQNREAQSAMDVARRSEAITRRGYQGGLAEYVNVLTAENRLFDAQRQAALVEADRLQASAGLAQALGGGFNAEPHP